MRWSPAGDYRQNVPMTVARDLSQTAPHLTVSGLVVEFGPVKALDGISLDLRAGEVVALAGENGAGKTTLVRCIAGDITPDSGAIALEGQVLPPGPVAAKRRKISVVWQDLALCDNLDVASNVMLGREGRRQMMSETRMHTAASQLFGRLGVPVQDTTRSVRSRSGGQRQLVAVPRPMADNPRLLLLDEPTASLGVQASALVEELILRLREQGTTILFAGHDVGQMFRLADRVVVLRQGRVAGEVAPSVMHPDDVVALISGQELDTSARRQLTRLQGLTGRLVSSDPSSSLSLILSALGVALGSERLCIHLVDDGQLIRTASFGVPEQLLAAWARLPFGAGGGPVGLAAERQAPVIEDNIRADAGSWRSFGDLARSAKVASSWSVPVLGPAGLLGVITVFRAMPGKPRRDDLDLAALYAGYAASAIERDRLLDQVTARNGLLETIREMLQTLAGAVPVAAGLSIALQALRRGLGADEAALATAAADGSVTVRAYSGAGHLTGASYVTGAGDGDGVPAALVEAARAALDGHWPDGIAGGVSGSGRNQWVRVPAPAWLTLLLTSYADVELEDEGPDLLEDAAHSLRMGLGREQALVARELQQTFLRRLSHELRTPLTAITGYATSLLQEDVTWDAASEQRFLSRIAAESARLGRLVNDLLDFSAIESGVFRLHGDWCDIPLVLDAAIAVLPPEAASLVEVKATPGLPAIWADHDRLEQVFVNLVGNALTHNPPQTRVVVTAQAAGPDHVTVRVSDDGEGLPPELAQAVPEASLGRDPRWHEVLAAGVARPARGRAGAGLGLSIAAGIVAAHRGRIELQPADCGTSFLITLPVEKPQ